MPRIPQISFASAPPASASGVRVSPGALAREVGEQAQAWQGLGDLAEGFGNLALDIQKRAVETQIMQTERDYGDMVNAYNNERLTNPDPVDWLSGFEERDSQFRDGLDSSDLPMEAQARLRERLENFSYRARTRIARDAALAQVEIGKQELLNRETAYTAEGDFEGAIQSWQENGPAMGYHPAEIEARAQRLTEQGKRYQAKQEADELRAAREADFNTVAGMLAADPFEVTEALDAGAFPSLDRADQLRVRSQARTAENRLQAETAQQMIDGIISGEASNADLKALADGARFSASQKEEIITFRDKRARLEDENGPLDYAAITEAERAIESYDPIQDETGETYARLYAQVELATIGGGKAGDSMAGAFRQRLYQKNPLLDHTQEPEGLSKEFTGVLDSYKKSGAFGDQDTEEGQREWATWNADLYRRFQKEVKRDPDQFKQRGAVADWMAEQINGRAFGEAIKGDLPTDFNDDLEGALKILGF